MNFGNFIVAHLAAERNYFAPHFHKDCSRGGKLTLANIIIPTILGAVYVLALFLDL